MKRLLILAVSALAALGLPAAASAGIFDDYYDYQNEDGTYSYFFTQGIKVTLDEEWYRNTIVKTKDSGATFYHKDSYEAYQAKGYEGGRLFTIGASVNNSFTELPHYIYIGFDEEEMMNYYANLPSDFQAYPDGGEIQEEYQALYATVEDVVAGIEILSADSEAQAPAASTGLAGGWSLTQDDAMTEESEALFEKAVAELDDFIYVPRLLLSTQIVSGTNYCFLARGAEITENPDLDNLNAFYALVYIYEDLQGNVKILDIKEIPIGF